MSKIGWCGDVSGNPYGPSEPPDTGCQRCGEELDWESCWQCAGAGDFGLYEEDPLVYRVGQTRTCDECNGEGGWMVCYNPKCQVNERGVTDNG